MNLITLGLDEVILIHDHVISPKEIQGLAQDKSLDGALSRIDYRLQYGVIEDVYDLAATYAVVIATGHTFNDANKRTAYHTMVTCLQLNGEPTEHLGTQEVGDIIIQVAQGKIDEIELAKWLRKKVSP